MRDGIIASTRILTWGLFCRFRHEAKDSDPFEPTYQRLNDYQEP